MNPVPAPLRKSDGENAFRDVKIAFDKPPGACYTPQLPGVNVRFSLRQVAETLWLFGFYMGKEGIDARI